MRMKDLSQFGKFQKINSKSNQINVLTNGIIFISYLTKLFMIKAQYIQTICK